MKKVVLLGDSIRLIGYGTKVPELLGKEYTVYQSEDNGRFTTYTLHMLHDEQENIKNADVIHWNNGLWDVSDLFGEGKGFTPIERYAEDLERIAKILLKITPNVIFATTTPMLDGYPYQDNGDISEYNEAAVKALKPLGVKINDLYSFVYPKRDEYVRADDLTHLTEKGIKACAEEVADFIKKTF